MIRKGGDAVGNAECISLEAEMACKPTDRQRGGKTPSWELRRGQTMVIHSVVFQLLPNLPLPAGSGSELCFHPWMLVSQFLQDTGHSSLTPTSSKQA